MARRSPDPNVRAEELQELMFLLIVRSIPPRFFSVADSEHVLSV
jgi:hypothetical protein